MLKKVHEKKITRVHIGCDYGGDFLKVALSPVFERNDSDDDDDDDDVPDTGELLTSNMFTSNISIGRRRIMLVAAVPTLSEAHNTLTAVFNRLNFPWEEFPFLFIADFKLLNFVFGISTNSSMYPCIYCERSLLPSRSSVAEMFSAGKVRTCASIKKHAALCKKRGELPKSGICASICS